MQNGRASQTAVLAAIQRAAHPLIDNEPWIFQDDFAAPLSGVSEKASVLSALSALETELAQTASPTLVKMWLQASRLSVALRARYAEDELSKAVQRGVSQYVILGAGFDSFAYRRRDLQTDLAVYEVDHPATQERKLARLKELGIEIPRHLTFVPIDFETDSIVDALAEQGYRREQPAFFSWLGVAQYLTGAAIDRTLGQIAATASGSEIVLNYLVPAALVAEPEKQILQMLESMTAHRGEPARSYFEPAHLEERLKALGFAEVWDLGADEATRRYLANRTDGLRISSLTHLAKARVRHSPDAAYQQPNGRLLA